MQGLRDAVMLAMLPVLQQQQPRKSPRDLVRDAYEFADEALYQRGMLANADSPWIAPETLTLPDDTHSGADPCIGGYKSHRWNPVTKVCDRCSARPATAHQRHAAARASREAKRARLALVKEA